MNRKNILSKLDLNNVHTVLPSEHGIDKSVDLNLTPEKQIISH